MELVTQIKLFIGKLGVGKKERRIFIMAQGHCLLFDENHGGRFLADLGATNGSGLVYPYPIATVAPAIMELPVMEVDIFESGQPFHVEKIEGVPTIVFGSLEGDSSGS